jgi:mannose PTS system EIIA component
MVGVLIVTHGRMAEELIKTAEFVVGKIDDIKSLCVDPQANSEDIRKQMEATLKELDHGRGILILTDMFGGTPSNIGLSFLETGKVEVLSGVNLPMLLRLASPNRGQEELGELADALQNAGLASINLASKILNKEVK